jgi:replicative DNA helicase
MALNKTSIVKPDNVLRDMMKTRYEQFVEGKQYIEDFRSNKVPTLITSIPSLNAHLGEGIEFGTTLVVGSRSGGGKTTLKDQLVKDAINRNLNNKPISVLDFSYEMPGRDLAIRAFISATQSSKKHLIVRNKALSNSHEKAIDETIEMYRNARIKVIDEPTDIYNMERLMYIYMEDEKKEVKDPLFLFTVDHSILTRNLPGDSTFDTLHKLGELATKVRKQGNVIFIILSQLNRSIEEPIRSKPGTAANYPNSADLYGADALLQHADMLILIDNPAMRDLLTYGPLKIELTEPIHRYYSMFHIVKDRRNGQAKLHLHANFTEFKFQEYGEYVTGAGVKVFINPPDSEYGPVNNGDILNTVTNEEPKPEAIKPPYPPPNEDISPQMFSLRD